MSNRTPRVHPTVSLDGLVLDQKTDGQGVAQICWKVSPVGINSGAVSISGAITILDVCARVWCDPNVLGILASPTHFPFDDVGLHEKRIVAELIDRMLSLVSVLKPIP
jgi:hypothetical protein